MKKLFCITVVALFFTCFITLPTIACEPGDPDCPDVQLPCVDCDIPEPSGPCIGDCASVIEVDPSAYIDQSQLQGHITTVEPCDVNTGAFAIQSIDGIGVMSGDLPGIVELTATASQSLGYEELGTLDGGATFENSGVIVEQLYVAAQADETVPEAGFEVDNTAVSETNNEVLDGGLASDMANLSCLDAFVYGLPTPDFYGLNINSSSYSLIGVDGWQTGTNLIKIEVGTAPTSD